MDKIKKYQNPSGRLVRKKGGRRRFSTNDSSTLPSDNTRVTRQPYYPVKETPLRPGEQKVVNPYTGKTTRVRSRNEVVSSMDTSPGAEMRRQEHKRDAEWAAKQEKEAQARTETATALGNFASRFFPSTIARAAYDQVTGKEGGFVGSMVEGNEGLGNEAANLAFDIATPWAWQKFAPIFTSKVLPKVSDYGSRFSRFYWSPVTGQFTRFGNKEYRLRSLAGMNTLFPGLESRPVQVPLRDITRELSANGINPTMTDLVEGLERMTPVGYPEIRLEATPGAGIVASAPRGALQRAQDAVNRDKGTSISLVSPPSGPPQTPGTRTYDAFTTLGPYKVEDFIDSNGKFILNDSGYPLFESLNTVRTGAHHIGDHFINTRNPEEVFRTLIQLRNDTAAKMAEMNEIALDNKMITQEAAHNGRGLRDFRPQSGRRIETHSHDTSIDSNPIAMRFAQRMFPKGKAIVLPTRESHVTLNDFGFNNAYEKVQFSDPTFETLYNDAVKNKDWNPSFLNDYNYKFDSDRGMSDIIVTNKDGVEVARLPFIPLDDQLANINAGIKKFNRHFGTHYPDAYYKILDVLGGKEPIFYTPNFRLIGLEKRGGRIRGKQNNYRLYQR